jgi:hypothetical protein
MIFAPLAPLGELTFTHIFGWTPGVQHDTPEDFFRSLVEPQRTSKAQASGLGTAHPEMTP